MARVVVNEINIRNKAHLSLKSNKYRGIARVAANSRMLFAEQSLLKAFDDHVVTKELQPENVSDDGNSALVSRGSLFSYLGFPEGSNPTDKLRNFLIQNIQMEDEPIFDDRKNTFTYKFPVNIPTKEEIDEVAGTPDEYSSKSWTRIIEEGIGGGAAMVHYIFAVGENIAQRFKEVGSRSGWGLQTEKMVSRGGTFTPVKYISEIIKNFKARFKR